MTTDTYAPSAVGERIRELCREFKLPTLAAETVDRFGEAGHAAALPTLMEVLEQEAEDRRIRRVDRLRRASRLPVGKTWDTFEHDSAPVKLRQQLIRLAEGRLRGAWRQRTGVRSARHGQDARDVRHRTQARAVGALRAVHPGVQAGAGYARSQARPRSAADAQEAGQLRPAGDRRPGLHAAGSWGIGGAVHPEAERYERRSLGITSNLVFSEWEKVFANCDDTLGPSGTGSDPFANWLRCPHRDLSIRSRGGP